MVHGDKAQGSRRRALREFTEGKLVLVATEVAARGLDIPDPSTWSTMIRRSWRKTMCTASIVRLRRGKSGMAISFVSREEERTLLEIEALIGQKIRRIMVPGYEVSSRDELIKQLQERRRFGKRPQWKTTPPPRPWLRPSCRASASRLAAAKSRASRNKARRPLY